GLAIQRSFTSAGTVNAQLLSNTKVKTVSIAAGMHINVSDKKLIVSSAQAGGSWNGSAYTGVLGMVQSGYNGGDWGGPGIVTDQSNAIGPNTLTALVAMSADDAGYAGGT